MPTQKTAIIIGASSGIGRSLVLQLVEKGYRVGIGARRMHLLKDIRKRAPQQIIIRQVNVTFRETAIKRIYAMIHELPGVDLFLYSSATGYINHKLNWNIIR